MTEAALLIAGALAGAVVIWLLLRPLHRTRMLEEGSRIQAEHTRQIAEIEARARGGEVLLAELRQQVAQRDGTILDLRRALEEESRLRVEAATNLAASQQSLEEQRALIESVEQKFTDTFKALSLDALSRNTEEFMKYTDSFMGLAEEKLRSQAVEGARELGAKKELIDQSLDAVGKTLSEVQRRIEEIGKASGEKFTEVATLIRKHEEVTAKLKDTTEHLGQALTSSKKRGEWGERMAEDIIRLVGMQEGVNYMKQKTLETSAGRPDYTFFLPHELRINMDVKFPMDHYTHYLNAETDHDRKRHREELLRNARVMIKQVTTREYINPAENTVDYVIIFIPNEQVYSFINEGDPKIMDEALRQKVILCSPFTLYAVLAVVRQAIENFNLERTASEILKLLAEFSKQWGAYKEKFKTMGDRLDAARKEYDALVTTRSTMLERPLRRIDELRKRQAIAADSEIPLLEE